jgi:hypothetical protein
MSEPALGAPSPTNPPTPSASQPRSNFTIGARWPLGVLAVTLSICALLPLGAARLLGLLLLSGLPPLLLVRRRLRVSDLIVVPSWASLWLWAVLAWSLWKLGLGAILAWTPALVAAALTAVAHRKKLVVEIEAGFEDAVVVGVAALAATWIVPVFTHNGMDGDRYLAHSWFGRDSFYFFALAQEALERHAWPAENPFLAGVDNWYPALLHLACGALSGQSGRSVPVAMIWMSPVLLATAPALLVSLGLRVAKSVNTTKVGLALSSLAAVLGVAGPFLLRPDLFIYPQTQCFAFGWLWLGLWLWNEAKDERLAQVASFVVLVSVTLAHSVTGSVAVIFLGTQALSLLLDQVRRREGAWLGAAALLVALLYKRVNALPFGGARRPFSLDELRGFESFLHPWWVPLAGLALVLLGNWRRFVSLLLPLGALTLGLAYYVYGSTLLDSSDRWFVYFNAERFLHLALLVAVPLAASGRLWGFAGVALAVASAIIHPTDLARSSKNLIEEAPLVLDASALKLFERIRAETPTDARVLSSVGGYALPAFTGRAQSPNESNLWALNTLPPNEFFSRLRDAETFWGVPPQQRLNILDHWGYGYMLINLNNEASDRDRLEGWISKQFPSGGVTLAFSEGSWILLVRAPH